MRKLITTTLLVLLIALPIMAGPLSTALKDYTVSNRALSIGVASWTEEDHNLAPAAYFNMTFVSFFDDYLRFGAGMIAGYDEEPLFRFQTSITARIFDSIEVGGWYAPFWGWNGHDDPYGVMVGYVFKFE